LYQTRALEDVQEQLKRIQNLTQFVADNVVLVGNDVKDIRGFCEVLAGREHEARSKKLERQDMPSKPAIFFGRDGLVKKVSMMLSSSETALHICLLGPGGMGRHHFLWPSLARTSSKQSFKRGIVCGYHV